MRCKANLPYPYMQALKVKLLKGGAKHFFKKRIKALYYCISVKTLFIIL